MGSNQLLLIVAALAILITLQLAINGSLIRSFAGDLDNEATIDATAIGEAMVDEIIVKAFDVKTKNAVIYNLSYLTRSDSLGRDVGDSTTVVNEREPFRSRLGFDDVDDYNKYTRIVTSPRLGDFYVKDTVYYVGGANYDSTTNTQTFYKKIVVNVTHPNLLHPVTVKSTAVYRQFF
jgi:hypothetical protein